MEENTPQNEERSNTWRDIVSILFVAYLMPIAAIPVWLISRWSQATKWVVTFMSIISLVILYSVSSGGYKYAKFQNAYKPVLEVQQALDIYGIQKGEYPNTLEVLKPELLKEIPNIDNLEYKSIESGKDYSLRAKIQGKSVELGPVLKSE